MFTEGLWQFASFILINPSPVLRLIPSPSDFRLVLPASHLFKLSLISAPWVTFPLASDPSYGIPVPYLAPSC